MADRIGFAIREGRRYEDGGMAWYVHLQGQGGTGLYSNPVLHPPHTRSHTLDGINKALEKCSPLDYKGFLKIAKALLLNGVIELFWMDWLLSCPSFFLHPETLHHFCHFSWDHDIKWCVKVVTTLEINFHFFLLQPAVG